MPKGPRAILAERAELSEEIAELEKAIDAFLDKEYDPKSKLILAYEMGHKPSPEAVSAIIEHYQKAGWSKVEFEKYDGTECEVGWTHRFVFED